MNVLDHGVGVTFGKRRLTLADTTAHSASDSVRLTKRARVLGHLPAPPSTEARFQASVILANSPLNPEESEEILHLLEMRLGHEALSYGDVIQHFSRRGVWLGSEARTWLLRILG